MGESTLRAKHDVFPVCVSNGCLGPVAANAELSSGNSYTDYLRSFFGTRVSRYDIGAVYYVHFLPLLYILTSYLFSYFGTSRTRTFARWQ